MSNKVTEESYVDLNARLNFWNPDGTINFEADEEAARQYHLQYVNPKTQYFPSLEDKLDFLMTNDYYERKVFETFDFEKTKALYKLAYSYKHRFSTFLGALKFYGSYALKTFDGEAFLERFEDRVVANAIGLCGGDYDRAKSLVEEIITGRLQPATPTFGGVGKKQRGELVSCFLISCSDDMLSIGRMHNSVLQLSKRGGGVGINLTNIREKGAQIKKTKGLSSGVVPICKMLDDALSFADQNGRRAGAGAVYLSVHHPDVLSLLDTKKENADEKTRLKTLSIGVVVTDIAYEKAKENDYIYQFSPYDVEQEYGIEFAKFDVTRNYDELVNNPKIKKSKIKAREFFKTVGSIQMESGYPYLLNIDTANRENPIFGTIDMSNLCVTGDTYILTDKGNRRVDELFGTQEDFSVVVDTRARDMDFKKTGVSTEPSTKMIRTAENADVYRISTLEGYELRATAWHKMYVERAGELVKIPLHEVEMGDKILVQSDKGAFGTIHKPDLAYFAGAMSADGTYGIARNGGESLRLDLYGSKNQFAPALTFAAHNILNGREDLLHKYNATLTPTFVESSYSDRVSLSSRPLTVILENEGFSKETKHTIPKFVLEGDEETQRAFINGVWQLDATITGNRKIGNMSIELGSVYRDFLVQMQQLLLNHGIYTRIYQGREGGKAMLPDGHGGLREYDQQTLYTIRTSVRGDREKLHDMVRWREDKEQYWQERCSEIKTDKYYNTHKYRATVSSIEFDGIEDVYDVTVENGNSVIFNGIVTGNCSEILQVSESSTLNEDLSYKKVGTDISCNLASLNIKKAMDGGDLAKTVDTSIRMLTEVSDKTSIEAVPTVKNGNSKYHSIGLGQFSLHEFFLQEGMDYGDENSLNFTNNYFMAINYYALKTSNAIARERQETFFEFEKSKYSSAQYLIDRYAKEDMINPNENTLAIFDKYGIQLPTFEDWEALAFDIEKDGLYNAYLQAVPPTGSISYINGGTSSIHPSVALIETRKEGNTGRIYYPTPGANNNNFKDFQDAYQIGPMKVIDVYAEAQKHVDQGLSLTLFCKETDSTKFLNRVYAYAHHKGVKTIYYCRVRSENLTGTNIDECVSCTL